MQSATQLSSPHCDSGLKFFDVPHFCVHIEMSATPVTHPVMQSHAGSAWQFMICAQQFALLHMVHAESPGALSQTGAGPVDDDEDVGAPVSTVVPPPVVSPPVTPELAAPLELAAPVSSPGPFPSSPQPANARTRSVTIDARPIR